MNEKLVIIDPQKGFIETKTQEDTLCQIVSFIENTDIDTIFTKIEKPNPLYTNLVNWSPSDEEKEICEKIHPYITNENLFRKPGYSAFTSTKFQNVVEAEEIKTMYLAGFETDGCILSTAFDAFDSEITPVIIEDLCSSRETSMHRETIKILRRNLGEDQVIESKWL